MNTEDLVNIKENDVSNFTEKDLDSCWAYYKYYLIDILNGDYDLNEAISDLRGLIGSEFDTRTGK